MSKAENNNLIVKENNELRKMSPVLAIVTIRQRMYLTRAVYAYDAHAKTLITRQVSRDKATQASKNKKVESR